MRPSTPEEDPKEKALRLRERRNARRDRNAAAQEEAADLSTDLRGVYGLRALSMFGNRGTK